MKATLRQIRITPKKVNLTASLVRNKKAVDAVNILRYTPKKTAKILKKLIESAMANAEHNSKQKKEDLYIKEIIVTGGTTLKRSVPISRGRVHPILKRTSHITVRVESSKPEIKSVSKTTAEKVEEVEEAKKAETPEKKKKLKTKKPKKI